MYQYLFAISVAAFLTLSSGKAQNIIGVVDYISTENPTAYLELEKEWQKVHEQRIKSGMIIGWAVYQVMFKTADDPYNFVTLTWYDGFSKLDKGVPDEIWEAAFPGTSKENWKQFEKKTDETRKLVSSGVFHQRLSCSNGLDHLGKYYVLNEISVRPGKSKEYLDMAERMYKPVYDEEIRNNNRTTWSLWAKWPGDTKDFQYVTADGYTDLSQIEQTNFGTSFKKIHPADDMNAVGQQMEELRRLVKSEMWKKILSLLP